MQRSPILLAMVACLLGCWRSTAAQDLSEKKLLQFGFGVPRAESLPGSIRKMEQDNPFFDAVVTAVQLRGEVEARNGAGKDGLFSWCVFGPGKVKWENVQEDVASLRAATEQAQRLRLFVLFNVTPGNVDWFDPAWDSIVHNTAVAGRIVREGGCAGLLFDVEEYGNPELGQNRPFRYSLLKKDEHTFAEYAEQARLRGRQWMDAFQKEAPNSVILFTWAHSMQMYWLWQVKGDAAWEERPDLSTGEYLLAPFIDGMIESAGPSITLYDGCEYTYGFRTGGDFALAKRFVREARRHSRVPDQYSQRMKAAFSLMVDHQRVLRGGFFPDEPQRNYFTPDALALALHHALEQGDGYAWTWSEKMRWWPQENLSPAYIAAFEQARSPQPLGRDPNDATQQQLSDQVRALRQVVTVGTVELTPQNVIAGPDLQPIKAFADLPLEARFAVEPSDSHVSEHWHEPAVDDSTWATLRVDQFWEKQGYADHDGWAWYRLRFNVSADLPAGRRYLTFEALDEGGILWLNGRKVAHYAGPWNQPFAVDVSDVVTTGLNVLVVKVYGGEGAGGLWGPIRLGVAADGASPGTGQ